MPTVRYTVLDGEVVAEKRGGVRREYVPDPLGSTAALLDSTQSATDTFGYWPYGEESSRTGTTSTPFRYVGTLGYYRDSATRSYVRARYLNTTQGRWMTQDPIGYPPNGYEYAESSPLSQTDPRGLKPVGPGYGNCCGPLRVPGIPYERPPIVHNPGLDDLDKACCNHDFCLYGFRDFCKPYRVAACDTQLCNDAIDARCSTRKCWVWKLLIIAHFCDPFGGTTPGPIIPF